MTADLSSFGAAPACVHMELLFFIVSNALPLVPSCTALSNRTAFPYLRYPYRFLGLTDQFSKGEQLPHSQLLLLIAVRSHGRLR